MKARTVPADRVLAAVPDQRYDWTYAASAATRSTSDAVSLARCCFQRAPLAIRAFLVGGWALLLLRGWPRSDERRVLGWPIVRETPETVLRRRSRLGLTATLVFTIADGDATFASAMTFTNRTARSVWAGVAPVHRWVVRTVLTRAADTVGQA